MYAPRADALDARSKCAAAAHPRGCAMCDRAAMRRRISPAAPGGMHAPFWAAMAGVGEPFRNLGREGLVFDGPVRPLQPCLYVRDDAAQARGVAERCCDMEAVERWWAPGRVPVGTAGHPPVAWPIGFAVL